MKRLILNPKYFTIAKYAVVVFAICLLMLIAVLRYQGLFAFLGTIVSVLMPIIWGFVFAYLLNPVMNFFEKYIKKLTDRKVTHPKLSRGLAVTATTILTIAAISALVAIVIPQVTKSLISIIGAADVYIDQIDEMIDGLAGKYPEAYKLLDSTFDQVEMNITDILNKNAPKISELASGATTAVKNFAIGLKDFLLGFIVMVYLLCGKENFKGQTKKIVYAVFHEGTANKILRIAARADRTFIGFISGKFVDSLIIGLMCFIGMQIMGMTKYALLISVIVGVTNMIPFFGPFFGAIPSVIILFFESPKQAIIFAIFILILQQFDGNILGPKILGNSTGLPAFWVMFAIFIGGGLFGFTGMLVGVPVFAVIYDLTKEYISIRLKNKNLPVSTSAYKSEGEIEHIPSAEAVVEAEEDKQEAFEAVAVQPETPPQAPKKQTSKRRRNDRKDKNDKDV